MYDAERRSIECLTFDSDRPRFEGAKAAISAAEAQIALTCAAL